MEFGLEGGVYVCSNLVICWGFFLLQTRVIILIFKNLLYRVLIRSLVLTVSITSLVYTA